MVPALSDEAWALLGMLYRASKGRMKAPAGFETSYAELEEQGLVHGKTVTAKGSAAWREFLNRSNPDLFNSKGTKDGDSSRKR